MKTKRGDDVPEDLAGALQADPATLAMWEALRPSCQREYVEWVASAKRPETRGRRVQGVLECTAQWYLRHHPARPGAAKTAESSS